MSDRALHTAPRDDPEHRVESRLHIVEWSDGEGWDAFVDGASDGTIAHRWGWRAVMERAYGHRSFALAATDDDRLVGVLPLTLVRSRLFGRHLVSMPFLDYGGICTDGADRIARALTQTAIELAAAEHARLELRHLRDHRIDLPRSLEKVTMLLALESDIEAQWKRLPSERRNRIRKGQRSGVTASLHGVDGLDDFYNVWSTNMRTLGSPPHAPAFFREILVQLDGCATLLVVRAEGQAIGGALLLSHQGVISIPYVSSLRRFFDRCPNQVLYWEAIRFAIDRGMRVLDFGRSTPGAGTYEAKRQWGAEPVQLYWHHSPDDGASSDHGVSERFGWATRVWRHLPTAVSNRLGPLIRRGIPN